MKKILYRVKKAGKFFYSKIQFYTQSFEIKNVLICRAF